MAHRADAAAPLLAKPDAVATPLPPAKRNKYPFFCAVLASMTSVLMGYSTYYSPWLDKISAVQLCIDTYAEPRATMHARLQTSR